MGPQLVDLIPYFAHQMRHMRNKKILGRHHLLSTIFHNYEGCEATSVCNVAI
jgi:hypothetical protein